MRLYMKGRYDEDSASSDPYEDESSEEEGKIDEYVVCEHFKMTFVQYSSSQKDYDQKKLYVQN